MGENKVYTIDFGGNILARITIIDNMPTVTNCIDGYGNAVDLTQITVTEEILSLKDRVIEELRK